ncbi:MULTISPECIES: restriction endonuclease subunit S [Aeromonas]|uniref:restriction endonuclease subunit S n=1 Tax=Aeromonas TaxID=642 RepID=UPI00069B6E04|nr:MULTISPECIES: restriction endonuclease subunit S [Aeromonas]MCX4117305.1 restriction endonuclease subunit S [Aeromonas hydrophila]
MSWKSTTLGEVLTLKRGYDLPNDSRLEGDVPVVSSSGITGYHNEPKVKGPAVVTGRYGTLGEVYYVDQDCWPLNTSLYVKDFKGSRPKYIYYFLQNILKGMQSDKAAVPGVNRNDLHARKVTHADSETEQKKIEDFIGKYDDLIENNKRRIALLEESIRLLYREWFVYFRFPGHEHSNIENGLPNGWLRCPLKNICSEIKDTISPEKVDPSTPYIGLEHIPRRSITLNEWGRAEKVTSTKLRFSSGDILFGKIRPYFHKVGFTFCDGIASSDALVIRPTKDVLYHYCLLFLSSDFFVALASKTVKEGSKMPRADWEYLKAQEINIPPESLLEPFNMQVSKIIDQLKVLSNQNKSLTNARNLLLPRLMNGDITV